MRGFRVCLAAVLGCFVGVLCLHVWRFLGAPRARVGGVVSLVSACPACLACFPPCHYCLKIEGGWGGCAAVRAIVGEVTVKFARGGCVQDIKAMCKRQ